MSDQSINIRISLTDQVSKNLQKVSGNLQDFSRKMKETGRNLAQVGSYMNMVGAGIVAPLTLAYKTAGNFNAEISRQLNQTKNVFNNLSVEIGKSLLPVMRQLTDRIANMVAWWKSLDQAMKDRIIQNVWNLGKNLIFLGTSLVIVGNSIKLLANLSMLLANLDKIVPLVIALVSPVGLIALGFVSLTIAMIKFKTVSDSILEGIAGAHNIAFPWLPKIDVTKQKAGFDSVRQQLEDFAKTYKEIMGSLSFKGKGVEEGQGFWSGFELATEQAMQSLRNFHQLGMDVANQLKINLSTAFASFIDDAFSGQLKRAQDYFAEFGKSILKMFAQVIAEMIAKWIAFQAMMAGRQLVGKILGLFSSVGSVGTSASGGFSGGGGATGGSGAGGGFHKGGLIYAHSGINLKSDEVPIIAQTGERVLSRKQNREYENGSNKQQPTVVVIQAWDTQDIMRNRKSIEGIIINALKNNSGVRGAVKTYG